MLWMNVSRASGSSVVSVISESPPHESGEGSATLRKQGFQADVGLR
jgi:hypothetical protein